MTIQSWDQVFESDYTDGMPAAATFGESILKAQVEIARRMKNGDLPARRAMQREIARLTAAQIEGN